MSQREKEQHREQENRMREHQEAQQRMREFNDFKFNVDLEYKDEFGHEMSKKDVHILSIRPLTCAGIQATLSCFPWKSLRDDEEGEISAESHRAEQVTWGIDSG